MVSDEMLRNEFRKTEVVQLELKVVRASGVLAMLFSIVSAGRAVISQRLFPVMGNLVTPLLTVEKRGWKQNSRRVTQAVN